MSLREFHGLDRADRRRPRWSLFRSLDHFLDDGQVGARARLPTGPEVGRRGVPLRRPRFAGDGLQRVLCRCAALARGFQNLPAAFTELGSEPLRKSPNRESDALLGFEVVARLAHAVGQPVIADLPEIPLIAQVAIGLEPLPAFLRRVEGEVHHAQVGVELGIERTAGVVRDHGRDHVARDPVLVDAPAAHAGRGDALDFTEGFLHRLLPPCLNPTISPHVQGDRNILRSGNLPEVAHPSSRTLVAHSQFIPGRGMLTRTKSFQSRQFTGAAQSEAFSTRSKPRHFNLPLLRKVVTHAKMLPEVTHGSTCTTTWPIESNHDSNHG